MDDLTRARLSKVGVLRLPEEWKAVRLGRIATTQYGISDACADHGAYRMLGMKHLQDGYVDIRGASLTDLSDSAAKLYLLRQGDILFNRTNSRDLVGKTALFEGSVEGQFVFASYLVRIAADRSLVLPAFLSQYMNLPRVQGFLKTLATPGVSQYNINPEALREHLVVPLPPLPEQHAIVFILQSLDQVVRKTGALIRANGEQRKALAQQLLTGRRRFPQFDRLGTNRETKYGPRPQNWADLRVADFAEEVSRKPTTRSIAVLSCTKHRGLVDSLEYFGKQVFGADTSNYKLVERNQFAYATNHIEEGSIGLLTHRDAGLVSPMYTVFKVSERVHAPFLFALFKTELYRHVFEVNTNSSVNRRGGLRWSQFSQIRVALPSVQEQRKVADVLETCDREITLLQKQLNALKTQKIAVMQTLLTGQTQLEEHDCA